MARWPTVGAGHGKKVIAWSEKDVSPCVGARRAGDLKASDVLQMARRMEALAAFELAHRVMQNCGEIMRYAVATDRAARNPSAHLPPPPPDRRHDALAYQRDQSVVDVIVDDVGVDTTLADAADLLDGHVGQCPELGFR